MLKDSIKRGMLFMLLVFSTCETPSRIEQIKTPQMRVFRERGYQCIEFIGRKTYSAPLFLYQLYEENKYRIHHEYRQQLEKPEILERVLEEIDGNGDGIITPFEAARAYFSEKRISRLRQILDSKQEL